MELLKILFFGGNEFSWRKALTAITAFVFAFAVIGFLFGLPEIPSSYQAIIAGVFGFYFFKEVFSGVKLTKTK